MSNPSVGQALPSGTVTFLFTDIEGCAKLAQEYQDKMHIESMVIHTKEE